MSDQTGIAIAVGAGTDIDDPHGPCEPWAFIEDAQGTDDCPGCGATLDETALETALIDASAYLYALSGRRYPGTCTATARPCSGRDGNPCWHGAPLVLPGDSPNLYPIWGACGCDGPGACSCCGPAGITLGHAPITAITQVKIDGDIVDPADYTIVGDVLARTDGTLWPCCQDLTQPDTETGTFSVAYTWGSPPPDLGKRAAIDLGCVLAKAACGDADCKATENVVRKTAGGVTVELQSPTDDILKSLPVSVRLFLDAYSPGGYRSGPVLRRPAVRGRCYGC